MRRDVRPPFLCLLQTPRDWVSFLFFFVFWSAIMEEDDYFFQLVSKGSQCLR